MQNTIREHNNTNYNLELKMWGSEKKKVMNNNNNNNNKNNK